MIWKSAKSEREDAEAAADLTQIVDALSDRRVLKKALAVFAIGNILIWTVAILFADPVYSVMSRIVTSKVGVVILGIPFGFGLFFTYCLFRLKLPTIEDNNRLDSDIMASFAYQADSTRRWFVWLMSVLGGVVNVFLLISANMYFSDQL